MHHRRARTAVAAAAMLLLLVARAAASNAASPTSSLADLFIVRNGSRLFFQGTDRPFFFVGANLLFPNDADIRQADATWARERAARTLDALRAAGCGVVRAWAFNSEMPSVVERQGLRYDRAQIAALDWLVWAAKARGMRVVLTLSSFWTPYHRIERYLYPSSSSSTTDGDNNDANDQAAARAQADGADVRDFYWGGGTNPNAAQRGANSRALFKRHAYNLITRVNPLTGLSYGQDPAIMGWAVLNEPRCPGCFAAGEQRAHWQWLESAAAFVRRAAPRQLVSASTEGFFVQGDDDLEEEEETEVGGVGPDPTTTTTAALAASARAARAGNLISHNSGAGAACEGEDWLALSAAPAVDLATAHLYERQAEWRPEPSGSVGDNPNWIFCEVDACYLPWLRSAVALRAALSGAGDGQGGGEGAEAAVAAAAAEDTIAGKAAARVLLPPLVMVLNSTTTTAAMTSAPAFDGLSKPFVLEEFGLTWHRATLAQRARVFALVGGMLRRAAAAAGTARNGGNDNNEKGLAAFAGALFWQASGNDTSDSDGYVVRVDRPGVVAEARRVAMAAVGGGGSGAATYLPPLPSAATLAAMATLEQAEAYVVAAAAGESSSGLPPSRWLGPEELPAALDPALAAEMRLLLPTTPPPPPQALLLPLPPALLINRVALASNGSATTPAAAGRRLVSWAQDTLDAFRRGPAREACAVRASQTWRPYREFNLTAWTAADDVDTKRDLAPEVAEAAAEAAAAAGAQGDGGDAALFEIALAAMVVNALVYA